jgi:hypothetical protein
MVKELHRHSGLPSFFNVSNKFSFGVSIEHIFPFFILRTIQHPVAIYFTGIRKSGQEKAQPGLV